MKTHTTSDGRLSFWCPGCQEMHAIPAERWNWNGDREKPTLSPSVKISNGHYADGWKAGDHCWCTYNQEHADDPSRFTCKICHFHLQDGMLNFCGDSTHDHSGKQIALEDVESHI